MVGKHCTYTDVDLKTFPGIVTHEWGGEAKAVNIVMYEKTPPGQMNIKEVTSVPLKTKRIETDGNYWTLPSG